MSQSQSIGIGTVPKEIKSSIYGHVSLFARSSIVTAVARNGNGQRHFTRKASSIAQAESMSRCVGLRVTSVRVTASVMSLRESAREGFVASQQGCCAPGQWEGFATETTAVANAFTKGDGLGKERVSFSYDYKRQMVAETVSNSTDGGKTQEASFIFDFGNHKGYQFNKDTQTCLIFVLVKSFRRFCIKDGVFLRQAYIGITPNRILTRTFNIHPPGENYNITAMVSWDDPKCVPIKEMSFGERNAVRFLNLVEFTDITAGIRDPSVFTPPDYCVKTFDMPHQGRTGHFLVDYLHNKFME